MPRNKYDLLRLSTGALDNALDSLFFVVRFPDQAAKLEALRHDVSVNIVGTLTDGRGNNYQNAIEHIALTNYPVIPGLGPWIPDNNDPMGLTFHKEALPVGDYYKQSEELDFEITPDFLDVAVENFDSMQENGVKVPLQLTHDGDGNQRGEVIQLYRAPRSKQLPAQNKPAGSLSKRSKAFVLRLAQERSGVLKMTLDELAALLGIQFAEGLDDAGKMEAVKQRVAQLLGQAVAQPGQAAASQAQQQVAASQAGQAGQAGQQSSATQGASPLATVAATGQPVPQLDPRKVAMTVSLSKTALDAVKAGYEAQLNDLITNYGMTPAEADEARKTYLTDDKVKLSLSRAENESDPFAEFVRIRKAGAPAWQRTGRTEATTQDVALSQRSGGKSPLMANREKRNEIMKSAFQRN